MASIDKLLEILRETREELVLLLLTDSEDDSDTKALPDNARIQVEDVIIPLIDQLISLDEDAPAKFEDVVHLEKAYLRHSAQGHEERSARLKTKRQSNVIPSRHMSMLKRLWMQKKSNSSGEHHGRS